MSSARGGLARKMLGFAHKIDEVIPGGHPWELHFGVTDSEGCLGVCWRALGLIYGIMVLWRGSGGGRVVVGLAK